jgi:small subunit ribosomal protein S1
MEQQELGMTDENITSAELSGSETAPVEHEETVTAVDETATEVTTDNSAPAEGNGLKRGALIEGTITATSPTQITLDLGEGREGVITSTELERMDPRRVAEDFVVGKTIRVSVVNPRNKDGKTILSYNLALEEADWERATEYARTKEVYNGRVGGYNKGGLIVRFGQLRGFVPQSQISETRLRGLEGDTPEQRYSHVVHQNIDVKVMEVDRVRKRLILSERAAERESRQAKKQGLITELQAGEERDGIITSLETFGAFVDIGGAEGLVHITELSHQHITHPRQAVSVGQKVRVKVIGIDPEKNRIALSLKSLLADPWDEIAVRYKAGTLVRATITKTAKFGAFARIEGADNIEGLIHISELSTERIEDPKEVVKKGDVLTLRVLRVDIAEKRLGLSLKQVLSSEYLDTDLATAFEHPELVAIPERPQPSRVKAAVEKARDKGAEIIAEIREETAEAREELSEKVAEAREKGAEIIEDLKEKAADVREDLSETVAEAREKGAEIIEDLKEKANEVGEAISKRVAEAREKGADIIEDIKDRLNGETETPEEEKAAE